MIDEPREDRFHSVPVTLLGGPACLLGVVAGSAGWVLMTGSGFSATGLPAGLPGAAAVGLVAFLVLGLYDDRRSCSPLRKGVLQGLLLLGVLLLWRPEGRLASWLGVSLAWFGAMALLNAWNYLDHADGIFASTSAVASVVLAAGFGGMAGWGCASGVLWGLCGAMLGFAAWNLPPARIFLGDAGSLPLGFLLVLAGLAIVDSGPPEAVPVAVGAHCVPLTDMLLVSFARLRERRHPFRGGRDHSAHRLTLLLGRRTTALAFLLAAAGFGAVGFLAGPRHPLPITVALPAACLLLALLLLRLAPPSARRMPTPPV
jgi:UDP-N-acetylmuramyl pentapeptide phosphotransferase/UDP-N-acetylglucosamine-1-phosphate transferase